jgi:bacteriorhodopsin
MASLLPWQFELVSHVLTLGYAAMAASIFYFILTIKTNLPKYRPSSVLSVVVMISALLLLFAQQASWVDSFTPDIVGGAVTGYIYNGAFSNGFRYLNWLIDVPMLLIQILFVVGVTSVAFKKYLTRFATYGVLMIVTGYIGQFYEPNYGLDDSGNLVMWLVWGLISTVFYVFVLVEITKVIKEGKANMKGSKALSLFAFILPLFYVAWTIYPVAYVMPLWSNFELAIVSQQVLYTIADVSSKVVYGVILQIVSSMLSEEQGFKEV